MAGRRFVALLRGINVGGSNVVRMADLRSCFEALGFRDVRTYIQSGNVLFTAPGRAGVRSLEAQVEEALEASFGYRSRVAIVTPSVLAAVVAQAPSGFGSEPDVYRYDVLFVLTPVSPAEVAGQVSPREGVDEIAVGHHAVYSRRLIARATQSRLSRLVQLPVYQGITIRNWNTTTTLLAMASEP